MEEEDWAISIVWNNENSSNEGSDQERENNLGGGLQDPPTDKNTPMIDMMEIINTPNASFDFLMEDTNTHDNLIGAENNNNVGSDDNNQIPSNQSICNQVVEEIKEFRTRGYQKELFEKACEQNVIICVETGSGKTLIAALLIQKFLRDMKDREAGLISQIQNNESQPHVDEDDTEVINLVDGDESSDLPMKKPAETSNPSENATNHDDFREKVKLFSPKRKFVVFLVHRFSLVTQQADFLKKVLPANHPVGSYSGEKGVDDWSSSRWAQSLATKSVLVMTAQIFLNLLRHGLVSFDEIVLLVIDEAHHATKNHPYRKIFQEFYHASDASTQKPHIFAMTATPVKRKSEAVKENLCVDSIANLEATLDSVFMTVSKKRQEEVASYLPTPNEFVARFTRERTYLPAQEFERDNTLPTNSTNSNNTLTSILSGSGDQNYFTEKELDSLQRVREQLGLLGTVYYAEHLLQEKEHDVGEMRELLIEQSTEGELENGGVSHKVSILLDVIFAEFKRDEVICVDTDISEIPQNAFKCIVFVHERIIASILAWLIDSSFRTLDRNELRAKAVVAPGKSVVGTHSTASKLGKAMTDFRSGEFGILVATNVIEEGIDIPDCGVVISFDPLISPTVYIQMKGRARMKNGRFIVLLANEEDESSKAFEKARYGAAVMASVAKGYNVEFPTSSEPKTKPKFVNDGERKLHSLTTSARIGATEAVVLLHRYCHMRCIGSDEENQGPLYTVIENEPDESGYTATVKLPEGCHVEFGYCTDPQRSATLAKREAALDAYRSLYRLGEVDGHLLPRKPPRSKKRALRTISNKQIVNNTKRWRYKRSRPVLPKKLKKASRMRSCHINSQGVSSKSTKTKPSSCNPSMKETEILSSDNGKEVENVPMTSVENESNLSVYLFKINIDMSYKNALWFDENKENEVGLITYNDLLDDDLVAVQCPSGEKLLSLQRVAKIPWSNSMQKKAFQYSRCVQLCLLGRVPGSFRAKEYEEKFANANDPSFLLLPLQGSTYEPSFTIDWSKVNLLLTFGWMYGPQQEHELSSPDNVQHKILCATHDKYERLYITGSIHPDLRISSSPGDLLSKPYESFAQYFEQKHRVLIKNQDQNMILTYHVRETMTRGKSSPFALAPEICKVVPVHPKTCFAAAILPKWQKFMALRRSWRNLSVVKECVPFLSLAQALQPNVTDVAAKKSGLSYERIEYLGDSVLKVVHTLVKFVSNPNYSEGCLTDDRSFDVSNKKLADFALNMKIQDGVSLASASQSPKVWPWFWGTNQSRPINISEKVLADCVEAILGAHFVTAGLSYAVLFLDKFGLILGATRILGIVEKEKKYIWEGVLMEPPQLPEWDKRVESENVAHVEKALGYEFQDKRHLVIALTHGSYSHSSGYSYQRYEYCGDAVIEFLLLAHLFQKYPELDQGDLTTISCTMLSNELFARITVSHNIHTYMWRTSRALDENVAKYVKLDKMLEDDGDTVTATMATPKVLGDLFESVIGAIVVDKGMKLDGILDIILNLMQSELDRWGNPEKFTEDPVTQLMKITHMRFRGLPQINFKDKPDDMEKSCVIKIQDEVYGTGKGSTRRLAKRNAAMQALKKLKSTNPQ